jgi:integrase
MASKKPYTLPILVRSNSSRTKSGQDWYVEYFFEIPDQPGVMQSFKVRDGINYITDPELKEKEAQQLLKDVTRGLERENHNPFAPDLIVEKQIKTVKKKIEDDKKVNSGLTLAEAMAIFKNDIIQSNAKPDTITTYDGYLNNFSRWLTEKELLNYIAGQFTEIQLEEYLNSRYNAGTWSARTFNNYLMFFTTFFARCQAIERKTNRAITYEYRPGVILKKKSRGQKNSTYPPTLVSKIKNILDLKGNEMLRDYVEWIFLSLMRPLEINNLRVVNINEHLRQIRIIGKTDDRLIPITNQLLRLINKKGLLDLNPEWYVFGEGGYPGPVKCRRDFFSEWYRKDVRKPLKLSEKYGPYSWKPTAMVNMVYAGFDKTDIMVLSGHKTVDAFEAYMRDLVIDKSSAMKGNAIEF